ncbi:hypothetical protein [Bradyrhizobium sp. WSM2793]|uniref:hypothetical protein n=1 Tax=Bradyrhizobium sp. WSM2793 TaxID=1038866 RepID=UPI0012FB859A|nr:hypothetical protein [Bradyrhizobium sp. WSM2793]
MSKFIARMARLIREIAVFLVPVLTVIKLLIEIADKAANCNALKLRTQVPNPRQVDFRTD